MTSKAEEQAGTWPSVFWRSEPALRVGSSAALPVGSARRQPVISLLCNSIRGLAAVRGVALFYARFGRSKALPSIFVLGRADVLNGDQADIIVEGAVGGETPNLRQEFVE